jgi:arylsulfatase A-like enzyme
MNKISRRDVLKAIPALAAGTYLALGKRRIAQTNRPNIIVIVFDAMSASNLSLYGYPRETTPSLKQFAERCHVYHAHSSAGNFTTTGTASMLTGLYPWTHRAFHYGGMIARSLAGNTIFSLADAGYYTTAFCQNPWADRLVAQAPGGVDRFLPLTSFSLRGDSLLMQRLAGDRALSSIASDEFLFDLSGGDTMASPLLGYLYRTTHQTIEAARDHDPRYPRGLPEIDGYALYANQEVYRGVLAQLLELNELPGPHLSYFHLYSPHQPYKPDRRHLQLFTDELTFAAKPTHPFNTERGYNEKDLSDRRLRYDQQVAHVDTEFGNLIAGLDAAGVLENSYVVVTADHGEMFERGFFGHGERMLYEPVVHIPLLIHTPGQTERRDVHSPTSNVDLAPTLFALSGVTPSIEFDGKLLPGLGGAENHDRAVFSMEASQNSSFAPVTKAVISMRRGGYKIIGYPGYEDMNGRFELYHLAEDPQELQDISTDDPAMLKSMREELLNTLARANAAFHR